MDPFSDKRVKFPGSENAAPPTKPRNSVKRTRSRKLSTTVVQDDDIPLEDIRSDISEAPRHLKAFEFCQWDVKEDTTSKSDPNTTDDYVKQHETENRDFQANSFLSAVDYLTPFKLKWAYGRLPNVSVINLTGLYKNHIAYATSNIVVIYDYVGNNQQCLQGHKNTITALAMDKECRFFASSDAGTESLIMIWDIITGKVINFFPDPHDGTGCVTVTFTGVDYILASIGAEEAGKQTVCLWDFDPKNLKKKPVVIEHFPKVDLLRELCFDANRPEFFTATGDKAIVFCTWIRNSIQNEKEADSIYCFKPRRRKNFMTKYKKLCNSLWMKNGAWLVTSTMAGYLCVWTPPVVLGLEDPPDPKKNVREMRRNFKLSDKGLTYFTIHKEYAVVGDEKGVIRFFDHDLKLLRWTTNLYLPSIQSIKFNMTDELPLFKKHLRDNFDKDTNFMHRENNSRVRDYSMGGTKDRELSMTTLVKTPMPCSDFIFSVGGGSVYYYHFKQGQTDLLVNGSSGKFVACDFCPGSNSVIFATRTGDIHVYDIETHKLLFGDRIFSGPHRVSTMKFHPTGFFVCFGLVDGMLTFRRSFSWRTLIPPTSVSNSPIVRITFSADGLLLSYFTHNKLVVLYKFLTKARSWMHVGFSRVHKSEICDVQFIQDGHSKRNRLFSMGLDCLLVEYDIENSSPGDPSGLRILKIMQLEDTCQPTAMVFSGPREFGEDCVTFANTLNKLRVMHYKQDKIKSSVTGPLFDRDHAITRLIEFPAQMSEKRLKKFIIFVRGNKLGIMDTPLDGTPHKYMAVATHPGAIIDLSVIPEKEQIFTIGYQDNSALQWETCVRSVELFNLYIKLYGYLKKAKQ